MNCCTPTGYRTIFGAKTVERDARRYRRKGLTGSSQWLLDTLTSDGVDERSLLAVGGGIGGLQIELLNAGANRAANIEIIDNYEPPPAPSSPSTIWTRWSSATSATSPSPRTRQPQPPGRMLPDLDREFGCEHPAEEILACADAILERYDDAPVCSMVQTIAYREASECLREDPCRQLVTRQLRCPRS